MLIGAESNHDDVAAIDPAIGGYGVTDIYLGEFSPHSPLPGTQAGSSANLPLKSEVKNSDLWTLMVIASKVFVFFHLSS